MAGRLAPRTLTMSLLPFLLLLIPALIVALVASLQWRHLLSRPPALYAERLAQQRQQRFFVALVAVSLLLASPLLGPTARAPIDSFAFYFFGGWLLVLLSVVVVGQFWRQRLLDDRASITQALSVQAALLLAFHGFWMLIGIGPLFMLQRLDCYPWLPLLYLPLAVTLLLSQGWLMRTLLRARPLPAGALRDRCTEMAARSTLPAERQPHFWLIAPSGGFFYNAFALSGLWRNDILITAALAERLTPDETVAICAHEVGHLEHRTPQWLRRYLLKLLAITLLAALWPVLLDGLEMGHWGLEGLVWFFTLILFMQRMNRVQYDEELGCDARAVELCGGDPRPLASGLERLHRLAPIARRWTPQVEGRSTHPSLARRLQALAVPLPTAVAQCWEGVDGQTLVLGEAQLTLGERAWGYAELHGIYLVPQRVGAKLVIHTPSDGVLKVWLSDAQVGAVQAQLDGVDGHIGRAPDAPGTSGTVEGRVAGDGGLPGLLWLVGFALGVLPSAGENLSLTLYALLTLILLLVVRRRELVAMLWPVVLLLLVGALLRQGPLEAAAGSVWIGWGALLLGLGLAWRMVFDRCRPLSRRWVWGLWLLTSIPAWFTLQALLDTPAEAPWLLRLASFQEGALQLLLVPAAWAGLALLGTLRGVRLLPLFGVLLLAALFSLCSGNHARMAQALYAPWYGGLLPAARIDEGRLVPQWQRPFSPQELIWLELLDDGTYVYEAVADEREQWRSWSAWGNGLHEEEVGEHYRIYGDQLLILQVDEQGHNATLQLRRFAAEVPVWQLPLSGLVWQGRLTLQLQGDQWRLRDWRQDARGPGVVVAQGRVGESTWSAGIPLDGAGAQGERRAQSPWSMPWHISDREALTLGLTSRLYEVAYQDPTRAERHSLWSLAYPECWVGEQGLQVCVFMRDVDEVTPVWLLLQDGSQRLLAQHPQRLLLPMAQPPLGRYFAGLLPDALWLYDLETGRQWRYPLEGGSISEFAIDLVHGRLLLFSDEEGGQLSLYHFELTE